MKLKRGFSLPEILMTLAIIGVVSAMGVTISRRGIDRAYNQYYYTGYTGIAAALSDAINVNGGFPNNPMAPIPQAFFQTIADDFKGQLVYNNANLRAVITAPNGIEYTFNTMVSGGANTIVFDMQVPAPKKKNAQTVRASFAYYNDVQSGLIIPRVPGVNNLANGVTYVNLYSQRYDLLPAYHDMGNGQAVNVGTYQTALCASISNNEYQSMTTAWHSCGNSTNAVTANSQSIGLVKIANPRKVF